MKRRRWRIPKISSAECKYTLLGAPTTHPETTAASLPGQYVVSASFEIVRENEDDFNKWYDEEHMELVARIPGWRRGRRFKLVESKQVVNSQIMDENPPAPKYLAVHELENKDVERSAEILQARDTDWAQRIFKTAIRREVRRFELYESMSE
ncbi:hypothetical protein C8R43DRAFT_190885 [Mycena crocata]|nr:hypothetical protein C8R43DRAFT_190885 [Mycena crocata]